MPERLHSLWYCPPKKTSKTAVEAARELGVTPAQVSRLIADGRPDDRRIGGMTLVNEVSMAVCAATPRKEAILA